MCARGLLSAKVAWNEDRIPSRVVDSRPSVSPVPPVLRASSGVLVVARSGAGVNRRAPGPIAHGTLPLIEGCHTKHLGDREGAGPVARYQRGWYENEVVFTASDSSWIARGSIPQRCDAEGRGAWANNE